MTDTSLVNKILYSDNNIVIAYKSHGTPTVPLKTQPKENTLLGFVSASFPEVLKIKGKNPWEGGALHRLDTDTAGLVVFSRTQEFFNYLWNEQKNGHFLKGYVAKTSGTFSHTNDTSLFLSAISKKEKQNKSDNSYNKNRISFTNNTLHDFIVSSYFRAFGPGRQKVKAEKDIKKSDNGILYSTQCIILNHNANNTHTPILNPIFFCKIANGFRHQIRVHLSTLGCPIIGDKLYNPHYSNNNPKTEKQTDKTPHQRSDYTQNIELKNSSHPDTRIKQKSEYSLLTSEKNLTVLPENRKTLITPKQTYLQNNFNNTFNSDVSNYYFSNFHNIPNSEKNTVLNQQCINTTDIYPSIEDNFLLHNPFLELECVSVEWNGFIYNLANFT